MKILTLRGYRHNSDLMPKSMRPMINKAKRFDIHFDFIYSPLKYEEEQTDIDYRKWWNADRETLFTPEHYNTVAESLDFIVKVWNSDNYDGIMGFSQGSL